MWSFSALCLALMQTLFSEKEKKHRKMFVEHTYQKQLHGSDLQKRCSEKSRQIHRQTYV